MATDSFSTTGTLRDEAKEAQQRGTTTRAKRGIYHGWLVAWVLLGLTGALILAAPKIVSGSQLGRQLVSRAATLGGVDIDFTLMRIGWNTPLRVTDARIRCKSSADRIHANQINCDLTLLDLLGWSKHSFGQWVIRGVEVECTLQDDRFSIEDDFASLQETDRKSGPSSTGRIEFKDIVFKVTDATTGEVWKAAKSNVQVDVRPHGWETEFSGTFTEPGGRFGSLAGNLSATTAPANKHWHFEFQGKSFPISVLTLLQRRFSGADSTIPFWSAGSATGTLCLASDRDGVINAVTDGLEVTNMEVVDPTDSTRRWSNRQTSIAGQLKFTSGSVDADLRATTDFATVILAAKLPRSTNLFDARRDPLTLLKAIDGKAMAEIDVAALQESLPGVLPLRDEVKVVSGKSRLQIKPPSAGLDNRREITLHTDALQAVVNGKHVEIEPIDFNAVVSLENDDSIPEQICWNSSFAHVVWKGDLRNGSSEVDMDLRSSATFLNLFDDTFAGSQTGSIKAKLQWTTKQDSSWTLTGSAQTTNLLATSNEERQIRIPQASGRIELTGRWGDRRLEELAKATMTIEGSDLNLRAELTSPVDEIDFETPLPMRIEATGKLTRLAGVLGPWMPEALIAVDGRFDAKFNGDFSVASGRLTRATIDLSQPRVTYQGHALEQRDVNMNFDGQWEWPQGKFEAKSFTMISDVIAAAMRGYAGPDEIDLKVAWQANLDRISSVDKGRIASVAPSNTNRRPIQRAAFLADSAQVLDGLLFAGDANGVIQVSGDGKTIDIRTHASATDFAVLEPVTESTAVPRVVPIPARVPRAVLTHNSEQPSLASNRPLETWPDRVRVVWSEPDLDFDASLRYDTKTKRTVVDALELKSPWIAAKLSGHATWDLNNGDVSLSGRTNLRLPELGRRLTVLAGTPIELDGIHESPLKFHVQRMNNGPLDLIVDGSLGWDSGTVAGLSFGPASVPVRMTETSFKFAKSVVAIGEGQVRLAGELQYRPGPAVLRLQPGVVAESIQLTAPMTDGWLNYIAPVVHRVEHIQGVFGAEIEQATVVLGSPDQSRVVGKLNIQHADMSLTPMTRELLRAFKGFQSFSGGQTWSFDNEPQGRVTMPSQVVNFDLDSGLVNHNRAEFALDGTQMATSGDVTLDGKLAIIVQLPRDYIAIGKRPQSERGRIITLPVTGPMIQPRIDPTGLGSVATIMASTARSARVRLSNGSAKLSKVVSERKGTILERRNKFLEDTDKVLDGLQRVLDDSDGRKTKD